MRTKFIGLFLFLLFSLSTRAQSSGDNTLLWEISGNELPQPSYLYGTIHLICKNDLYLGARTLEKLKSSQRLVLEIDLSKVSAINLQKKTRMAGDTTLDMLLTPEEYATVARYFNDSLRLPLALMKKTKPLLISAAMLTRYDECDASTSVEDTLIKLANAVSIPIGQLETAEYQLSLFDSISYQQQAKMLLRQVTSPDSRNDLRKLLQLYMQQDLQGLNSLVTGEMEKDDAGKAFEAHLLDLRNHNWISKMEEMMAAEPVFFGVGAAHLPGSQGVIELLRQSGFTVTPLKN